MPPGSMMSPACSAGRSVTMLMPHHPTEARFFDQLLVAVNAPAASYFIRSYPSQEPAIRLLRQLGTRVVVIDELNSVLAGTPRQQRVFLQLLRFFVERVADRLRRRGRAGGQARPAVR